jgi:hypothetical protein
MLNSVIHSALPTLSLLSNKATMSDATPTNTTAPSAAPAPATALDPVASDAPAIPASFQKFINQAENVRAFSFHSLVSEADSLGRG